MDTKLKPQVGVVTIVVDRISHKILFGKRLKPIGHDMWALPGGHLETYETFEECAKREVMEESGITIKDIRFLTACNNRYPDHNKHYVTIIMIAEHESGIPHVPEREKEKCGELGWFDLDNVPEPLFDAANILFSNVNFLLQVYQYILDIPLVVTPSTGNVKEAAEAFQELRLERQIP